VKKRAAEVVKEKHMVSVGAGKNETAGELTISAEKTFYIIVKAGEFDEKVAPQTQSRGRTRLMTGTSTF
jgi:hypothetical protein